MTTVDTKPGLGRAPRGGIGSAGAAGLAIASIFVMAMAAQAQQSRPPASVEAPQAPLRQDAAPPNKPPQETSSQETSSQETPAAPGRYSFSQVNGSVLRLDTVGGQISACSQHGAGWVCQAVPEERAALEKEIGRLQGEVASLKAEVTSLRARADALAFSSGKTPPRPPANLAPRAGQPDGGHHDSAQQDPAKPDSAKPYSAKPDNVPQNSAKSILPSQEQIDRARAALHSAWQRLVDMIVGIKNDVMKRG